MYEGFTNRLEKWMDETETKQVDIYRKGKNKFTKAYVSMVKQGKREPNQELLTTLSDMSGKSVNWWINGKDDYESWYALKELCNMFFDNGMISEDGEMNETARNTIISMVEKEIRDLAKKRKNKK